MAKEKEKATTEETAKHNLFTLEGHPVKPDLNLELMGAEDYDGPEWVSNYNPTDPELTEYAFIADNKGTVDVDSESANRFVVKYWSIQRRVFPARDDQESRLGVSLCLINDRKQSIVMNSDIVLRFWAKSVKMRGFGPWENGLPVKCEKVAASQGRKMIRLRIVS